MAIGRPNKSAGSAGRKTYGPRRKPMHQTVEHQTTLEGEIAQAERQEEKYRPSTFERFAARRREQWG